MQIIEKKTVRFQTFDVSSLLLHLLLSYCLVPSVFFLSLCLSVSLCLRVMLCVMLCCVVCRCGRGVCVWCVCVLLHAEKTWKNPSRTCVSTCARGANTHGGRFECTYGGVFFFLNPHTGGRRQFCSPRKAHVEFSLVPREVHQRNRWIVYIFRLRTCREQHVPIPPIIRFT